MLPINTARLKPMFQRAVQLQSAGQTDQALALFTQVLATHPNLPEAHFQIGRIHAAQGNTAKAEAALRKALKLRPKEPEIWKALAQVLSGGKLRKLAADAARAGMPLDGEPDISAILSKVRTGQFEVAEADAMDLVRRFPNAARPALALGITRAAQQKWGFAVGPLEKAVERDPGNPKAQLRLGEVLLELGQVYQSEQALLKARDLGADVAMSLAKLLRETCRDDAAEKELSKAVSGDSKSAHLLTEHANVLAALRRPKDALRAGHKAVSAGASRLTLLNLADALSREGDAETALMITDAALTADPENAQILTLRGQLLQTNGDLDGARQTLLQAIAASKDSADAIRAYVGGTKVTADDPILTVVEERLANSALPKASRWVLSFAMAKALEDLGRYEEVFDHLHRANRLMKSEFPYKFENEARPVQAILDAYRALKGRDLPGETDASAPIFVTGMARSGTTLVETILSAHSAVTAGGELPYLAKALSRPIDVANMAIDVLGNGIAAAGQNYMIAARRRVATDGIFTDKAISTYARIGLAAIALPNARFMVLRRDPRDVGLSIYRNMFPPGNQLYSTDLHNIGRFIRQHDALVEFWRNEMPDKVHIVDYEDLTADPDPNIRALLAAAGLDWEDACLQPHKSKRRVETLSFAQVRQPIYRASVAAWKRYENELEPLFEALEKPVTL